MSRFVSLALVLAAVAACGPRSLRHVAVDRVPLGKVVVYRNGVAFYERRAAVDGGKLVVRVPRERVDDFLKSLTVVDAKTQRPLPVSFSRQQAADAQVIEMQLDVGDPGARADVVMTYVTDAAAWKPSYRLVLGDGDGTAMLEGWAVVDNLSGEDWNDVVVGVGASAAMSFRYDLWSVRTVEREQLDAEAAFAVAPPTAVSPYGGVAAAPAAENLLNLDADEIRGNATITEDYTKNIPVPGRTFESVLGTAAGAQVDEYGTSFSGSTSVDAEYVVDGVNTTGLDVVDRAPMIDPASTAQAPVRAGDTKVAEVARALRQRRQHVVVHGYAGVGEANAHQVAIERANLVRNQLIDAGVAPGRIRVVDGGAAPRPGVQLVTEAAPAGDGAGASATVAAASDGAPVGESLFASGQAMTVRDNTSAMVSILRATTSGREAYLYDGDGERGNARFAFKAVRLENPTDATLEPGPITVYGDGRYVGEGLTEAIAPHASVVVPYALDRQIVVDREDVQRDELSRLVTVERGVLTAEVEHLRQTTLTLTNRARTAATVYVRQAIEPGWTLRDPGRPFERIGDARLVAVELDAGATTSVTLIQATPLTRRLVLGDARTLDQLAVYVRIAQPSGALRERLDALLRLHRSLIDTIDRIASLRDRGHEYRLRQAELTGQLIGLRKVKTAAALSGELASKAADMAARVQATTLALVDAQDELLLLRVQFADAIAELHHVETVAVAP